MKKNNLALMINSTLNILKNNFQQKDINLNINFEAEDNIVKVDEDQMKQVFLNLFLNAIDAMPRGGMLTVKIVKKHDENSITILVEDTGRGISRDDLKSLFTPFFTTKKHGIGLGLVITQEIIRNHLGEIEVSSEINKGTSFTITLPLNY